MCTFCLFFCAASDKQTLLNNDQLYQVREYEMKETVLVSSGKILERGVGWASYLEVTMYTKTA